jgi:hypothetical protein
MVPPPEPQVVAAFVNDDAAPGSGLHKVLGWSLACVAGLGLVALAIFLVQFCFTSNATSEGEKDGGSASANEVPVPLLERKVTSTPLITLPPEEQQKVDEALRRGVEFHKRAQAADGAWPGDHPAGYTALATLTLLECGVLADDPHVRKGAQFIRQACTTLRQTYEIVLAILLLSRLDNGADRPRIQQLALRLMAGQQASGGWAYNCPALSDEDESKLLAFLQDGQVVSGDNVRRARADAKPPPRLGRLPVLGDPAAESSDVYRQGSADNSNTQFAILALWTARKHGVPVDRSLGLIVRRFRSAQNDDGSWDYRAGQPMANQQGNPTMTCAGLLGLAVGIGLAAEGDRSAPPPAQDPAIQKALHLVAQRIEQAPKSGKRRSGQGVPDMYFLWSVERVAVLYHLPDIDGKPWYPWGMEQILRRQEGDGGWKSGGGFGSSRTINTCFAMLFLKRVNLAKDLTDKITELSRALPMPAQPGRKP